MKRALFLSSLVSATQPAIAQSNVLLEAPVKITADAGTGSKTDAVPATTALNLAINRGPHEFRLTVMQRGDIAEALAAYTRRVEDLMRIRTFARTALCEGSPEAECSEALRLSALMLAGIRPREKPRSRGNVKSVLLPPAR